MVTGYAWSATLQGKLVLAAYGPVANGTLTLNLSQAGVVPGSFAVVAAEVACYTSADGSVVGAPNPLLAPTGGPFAGSFTLPAGTYYVELAYTGAGGQTTLVSPEVKWTLTAAGYLAVFAPALSPANATAYAVYIGTTSGGETLQGSAALGQQYVQGSPLISGVNPPAVNNFTCSVAGNDTLIPAYTYYTATLTDVNGNVLAGYPQNWYISGAALDVSQILPLSSNPAVRFPQPILAAPASPVAQSLASALNMNGFSLQNSGNVGPGFFSGFWSGTLPAAGSVLSIWVPYSAVTLRKLDVNAQAAGTAGTAGLTLSVSDGTNICSFGGLLVAAATATSVAGSGACSFNAGVPLTFAVSGDDHTTRPGNVSWDLEVTAR